MDHDHDHLIAVCDTVLVFANERITARLHGDTLTTARMLTACYPHTRTPTSTPPSQTVRSECDRCLTWQAGPAVRAARLDLSAPVTLGIADTLVGELNVVHHGPLWATTSLSWPIVVILGTGALLGGAALGINIVPTAGISVWLVNLTRHPLFGLQVIFYLARVLALATWYFATYTPPSVTCTLSAPVPMSPASPASTSRDTAALPWSTAVCSRRSPVSCSLARSARRIPPSVRPTCFRCSPVSSSAPPRWLPAGSTPGAPWPRCTSSPPA